MRFVLFLFLLFSLSSISSGHPWGDLSIRHRRGGDERGTSGETSEECFFAKERRNPLEDESIPRPKQSQVGTSCKGTLKSVASLFETKVNNLFQCPNYPALIFSRGGGEFDINWSDKDEREAIGKRMICPRHEAELGRNWDAKRLDHYKRKPRPNRTRESFDRNAFTFEGDGLRVHRFWNIGAGKKIPYTNFDSNDAHLVVEPNGHGGAESGPEYWAKLGEPRVKKQHTVDAQQEEDKCEEEEEDDDEDEDSVCQKQKDMKQCKEKKEVQSAIYRCHIEHCAKEFLSEKNLEKHLTIDKHLRRPEVENVLDYALHQYSSFLEMVFPPQVCPVIDEALNSLADDNANGVKKKMGWALPKRKRSTPFPKTVKEFLRKIYDEGAKTGAKTNEKEAEEMMRVATKPGGGMLFAIDDLLTSRQIAGVYAGFKRTTLEKRGKVGKRTQKKKKKKELDEGKEEGEPMEVDEVEIDEVNELFDTEGDEELEYDTEPLFDVEEAMHRAILAKKDEIFDDDDDEAMDYENRSTALFISHITYVIVLYRAYRIL